jgi:hypothetical protein
MTARPAREFWIPGPLPGMNELIAAAKGEGGRGLGYSRLKRQWGETISLLALAAGLHRDPWPRLTWFHFEWWERDKRRDKDNVAGGGRKLILDGLVKAGALPGDGWAYVDGWTDTFMVGDPGVRVWMVPKI